MSTYDDLLRNSDSIQRTYQVNFGNGISRVATSFTMIKTKEETTKFEEYIERKREGEFQIFPEEMDPAEVSSLGEEDCKRIDPLQFVAMTEARIILRRSLLNKHRTLTNAK
mmetsp:Transcript_16883/g.25394  ORF Transcript_16883/g.25394 Transcript_16883/m.25394 type:complete len:111 (+) Transcript_16883:273-605(+)